MPNRYHHILLSAAKPGMILSDAVLDTKGNVLLPKGTLLNDGMLASLLRHQIATVVIAGGEVSTEVERTERAEHSARVDHLFRQPGSTNLLAPPCSAASNLLHQYILHFRSSDLP